MASPNTSEHPEHTPKNSSDGLPTPASQIISSPTAESSSAPAESSSERNHPAESSSGRKYSPYDVFISHYGQDTKHTVASSIYDKLNSSGLTVFLDKDELKLGDKFPIVIENAIATASLHIAIFSKNYCKSNWCLDELEWMLQTKAIFIPIFYYIEPFVLRWVEGGKGIYANDLSDLEKKGRYSVEQLQRWKSALHEASLTTGKIIENQCDEEKDVLNVVTCVLKKLKKRRLDVTQHPMGLDEAEEEFNNIALRSRESIQIVGIWGMGGSGKTTLAKHIYNNKCSTINSSSFLFDVREAASKGKLHKKQRKLIEDLKLKVENEKFDNIDEGKGVLRRCWRHIPVLVVLDDVDHKGQLDALLPVKDILCRGSIIIVTTRDLHVLKQCDISAIYAIRTLNDSYAMELFSWHAFGQPSPSINFEELAEKFIDACGGLPLSLKVIGSLLHGELRKEYWESQLHKLSRIVLEDIKSKLKTSYDALDYEEQQMFLDIACFFIGWPSNRAIATWDGSGWSGLHGWQTLVNKCLVELDIDDTIRMHDHLRDLGREIANKQSPYRLWSKQQIIEIQPQQQTIQIRGMTDAFSDTNCYLRDGEIRLKTSQGERFVAPSSLGLKILIAEDGFIEEQCSELFSELLCFRCSGFPHQNIPSMKYLRSLELRAPQMLHDLWECNEDAPLQLRHLAIADAFLPSVKKINALQRLTALETLEIQWCTELKTLPSLAGLTSLENFGLSSCKRLEKIEGLECLRSLKHLRIDDCTKVKHLPSLTELTSLENINLSECYQLEKIEGLECLRSLKHLTINDCTEVKHLPSLAELTSLENINLSACHQLEKIEGLEWPRSLKNLNISGTDLKHLPSLAGVTSLESIYLYGCDRLEKIEGLECVRSLNLSYCEKLEKIESLEGLKTLEKLSIEYCKEVKHLPSLAGLTSLKSIDLRSCQQLEKVEGLEGLISLETLSIFECTELKTLPRLSELTSLEKFSLIGCKKVEKVEGLEVLKSLKSVEVDMSGSMVKLKLPEQSERLKSVKVAARRISEIEPSTREMQKWSREEMICTMGVIDVRKLLSSDYMLPEDVLHTYSSEYRYRELELNMPESSDSANKNAFLMCFILHSIHPNLRFQIRPEKNSYDINYHDYFYTEQKNLAEESIWVWMGIFPQQSYWVRSQKYIIKFWKEGAEVEVKEGWLMRGTEQSIREAFHHLISYS